MKRLVSLWVLFFFVVTQSFAPSARAVIPLAPIAVAAVGAAMVSSGIASHYAKTGEMPAYVDKAASSVASAADMMFQPAVLAAGPFSLVTAASFPTAASMYLGRDTSVGATLQQIQDFAAASVAGAYQAWKDFLASKQTQAGQLPLPITQNDYLQMPDGSVMKSTSDWIPSSAGGYTLPSWFTSGTPYGSYGTTQYVMVSPTTIYRAVPIAGIEPPYWELAYMTLDSASVPATVAPGDGTIAWPDVKNDLKNSAPPAVQNDIQNIIRALADSGYATIADGFPTTVDDVSPPPAVTSADVAAAIRSIAQGAQAAAQEAAADAAAANDLPGVGAAIAAGNAANAINDNALDQAVSNQAAELVEPEPETFDPVVAAPFETPFDPGAFDIPARFTTFLNNVQSTGLFSFSSSFFNSLPGGGSPIYTVEAGTYGTHTIDISETMGTGLAVLKTVLLLLFGFLSIRVVILKR